MNTKDTAPQKLVAGLAALVLLAGFGFGESRPTASAPAKAPIVAQAGTQSLVSAELPQDQVRDMTYN